MTAKLIFTCVFAAFLAAQNGVWSIGTGRPRLFTIPVVAPGDVVTFNLVGLPLDQSLLNFQASELPWPTKVGQFELKVQTAYGPFVAVPIKRILQDLPCGSSPDCVITYATVQLPYELALSGNMFVDGALTEFSIQYRGQGSTSYRVQVNSTSPHLAYPCDYGCQPSATVGGQSVFGQDVQIKPGAKMTIRAYGLGRTEPLVGAGQPSPQGAKARIALSGRYSWLLPDLRETAPPELVDAGSAVLVPGEVGLYEFSLIVPEPPAGVRSCKNGSSSNLLLRFGLQDTLAICVAAESSGN